MHASRWSFACALFCLQGSLCQAQDTDAQARAQREAGNPLRMIIEAGKLKPRAKAAEPEPAAPAVVVAAKPAAAEKAAARPPVAKPAAPSPTIAATIVAVAETPPPIPQPEVAATPEPEPAQPVPKEAEATPAQAVPETQPVEPAAATRAEPEPAPAASTALALSSVAAPIPAAPPAVASPLVLTAYVAPEFPERIKRRMRVDGEVVLGFTVKPDGSVADVTVRSSTEKSLEPNAIDAVRQWRYKPIDEAQLHAVQLVFRVKE